MNFFIGYSTRVKCVWLKVRHRDDGVSVDDELFFL